MFLLQENCVFLSGFLFFDKADKEQLWQFRTKASNSSAQLQGKNVCSLQFDMFTFLHVIALCTVMIMSYNIHVTCL